MKKLNEIPQAWRNANLGDLDWEKDKLIERLENEGHKTISVDRAVIVVEQCEDGDDFPKGWSADPLRVTVYPDPDAGFGSEPYYVFLHAGRAGLMDILLSEETGKGWRTSRLMRVDPETFESLCEINSLIPAKTLRRLAQQTLSGYYRAQAGNLLTTHHDEELGLLAGQVVDLLDRYIQRLETHSDLFRGWRYDEE